MAPKTTTRKNDESEFPINFAFSEENTMHIGVRGASPARLTNGAREVDTIWAIRSL